MLWFGLVSDQPHQPVWCPMANLMTDKHSERLTALLIVLSHIVFFLQLILPSPFPLHTHTNQISSYLQMVSMGKKPRLSLSCLFLYLALSPSLCISQSLVLSFSHFSQTNIEPGFSRLYTLLLKSMCSHPLFLSHIHYHTHKLARVGKHWPSKSLAIQQHLNSTLPTDYQNK